MDQAIGNIKTFWARCTGDCRRSEYEPTKSLDSVLDLEEESDVPPPYSVLPLDSKQPRSHTSSAVAEKGSGLVHKIGGVLKAFRAGAAEWGLKRRKERVEQLSDALRLCMVQDYLIPTSSLAAEPESLGINRATAWGLNCADVSTNWEHLLEGLITCVTDSTYEVSRYSSEALGRIYMPAKALGLDPMVV
ncbi:hypothetical protein MMC17_006822 [Xylographa soralifera]|nr:hypothetical protein [Xylographa soralifera]